MGTGVSPKRIATGNFLFPFFELSKLNTNHNSCNKSLDFYILTALYLATESSLDSLTAYLFLDKPSDY